MDQHRPWTTQNSAFNTESINVQWMPFPRCSPRIGHLVFSISTTYNLVLLRKKILFQLMAQLEFSQMVCLRLRWCGYEMTLMGLTTSKVQTHPYSYPFHFVLSLWSEDFFQKKKWKQKKRLDRNAVAAYST